MHPLEESKLMSETYRKCSFGGVKKIALFGKIVAVADTLPWLLVGDTNIDKTRT